jgi:hypothetical protein
VIHEASSFEWSTHSKIAQGSDTSLNPNRLVGERLRNSDRIKLSGQRLGHSRPRSAVIEPEVPIIELHDPE